MANLFAITAPTTVNLGSGRRGQAVFTVSNISGQPTRGRARLASQNPLAVPWLAIQGETERDFPVATTQQLVVAINVPPSAPPGRYVFRLDMVGVDNPDEDFSQGPGVTFEVTVVPVPKFPWWIVAVAAAVLLLAAAVIIGVILTRKTNVPDVSGITQAAAERQLEAEGFKVGGVTHQNSGVVPKDLVIGTDPPAGDAISPGSPITILVSDGQALSLGPTLTPTATNAPEAVVTTTFTPTQPEVATFTFTPTLPPAVAITPTFTPTIKKVITFRPILTLRPPKLPFNLIGLIADYPLLSDANESTNQTAPMTLVNAPFASNGVSCNGIYEGSGDPNYCKITTPQLDALNYASLSISIHFNPAEVKRMPVIVGGRSYRWIGLYLLANGHIGLMYNNSNITDCGQAYAAGNWYDGTLTYNGTTAKLYLGGTQICSQDFSLAQGGDKDISVTDYGRGLTFHGVLSDLKIYSTVITP